MPRVAKGKIGPYYWGSKKRSRAARERWGIAPDGRILEFQIARHRTQVPYQPGQAGDYIKACAERGSDIHKEAVLVAAFLRLTNG